METSILNTIKPLVGITVDFKQFDLEIITAINTAFSVLTQLGVGPKEGFVVSDENTSWSDFIGESNKLEMVKSFVQIKTRLLFDPPSSSFVVEALKEQLKELEWRINVEVD